MSKRFIGFIAAAAAGVATYLLLTGFRVGGHDVTVTIEDYGQALVAAAAAAACLHAAWRTGGRTRLGWLLLSASAASWSFGELYWAVAEVNLGIAVPFPSVADASFLAAIPIAAAALLAFPFGPATTTGRLRAVLDALIVGTCLAYVAWGLGPGHQEAHGQVAPPAELLAAAYPVGDVMLLILVAMSVRRAGPLMPLLVTLGAAFGGLLVADSGFAYLNLGDGYGPLGSVTDAGWIAGYLCVAVAAATFGVKASRAESQREDRIEVWQLTLPWAGVLAVIAVSGWAAANGYNLGNTDLWIGSGMGVIFLASQVLTLNDALRLLVRSKRAEATLDAQRSLLDQVISNAPIGVERVAYDLSIIDANPAVCSMLRAPRVAVVGSSIRHYLSPETLAEIVARFAPLRDGSVDRVEADSEVRRADGSTMWVHWLVTGVRTPNGKIDYFLVILDDITAKHAVEEAERANVSELERINRLKSEFMSMVSHEFRTALTGIQGYSEILTTEEVSPEEVKQFAGDINSESLRLNRMITEMLDLDRIESGRVQLHPERLDLNALIADAVERAQMGTEKHQIVPVLQSQLPAVDADRDRVTQVVSNLLSNAVKYSPQGGEIRVATRIAGDYVEVSVTDHGQGIPPEFIGKIFGRYERYEGAGKAQVVGTGLGLAISQQIVQLHSGRIWVESVWGAGSTFRFVLPLPVTDASAKVA